MHSIDIYRAGSLLVTIKLDESSTSTQNKQVMGENFITLDFNLSFYQKFKVGDYCTVFSEVYKILELPVDEKISKYDFKYSIKMQAEGSDLSKVQYLFLGDDNTLKEPQFSLMGNAQTFIDLILSNTNRFMSGWTSGEVITTDYKNITFSNDSCLSALAKIADEFKTEWWVIGKTIYLTKKSVDTGITFKHGRGKGLYRIQRQQASSSDIITRLYPYGGEKNLPSDYGSKKLRLTVLSGYSISGLTAVVTDVGGGNSSFVFSFTPPIEPGATALTIRYRLAGTSNDYVSNTGPITSPRTVVLPTAVYEFIFVTEPFGTSAGPVNIGATFSTPILNGFPQPYIENNVSEYGVIEHSEVFDEIYPRRTGTVTSVDATDVYKFTDAGIDFDINTHLLPGLIAKVVFNTGQLAGYQFDISTFDNGTKQFKILKNKDETAIDIPSSLLKPAIGDKYVLVDIKMPQSYITAAENELLTKAQTLLEKISIPQYTYAIEIDPKFIKDRSYTINIGDEVWITDSDFELNRKIRVLNTSRNLVNENVYKITLSDYVTQGTIIQINNSLLSNSQDVSILASQLENAAIFNGKVIGDLTFQQGTAVLPDMPSTAVTTGFDQVYRQQSTGKLYKKV